MKQLKHTKMIFPVLLLLSVLLLLTGCNNKKKIAKHFSLSQTEISVTAGETVDLVLSASGEKDVGEYTVSWISEDESIASVNEEGTVTGITKGTTTVSAVVKTKKAEVAFPCSVTVAENTTPISSISFAASIYSLGEGQTLNLYDEVIYYPANAADKSLTWTSSNPAIASVKDGVVNPASEGVTTITATTPNGSISASCTVRVSEVSVDATGITFKENGCKVTVGRTVLLTATVTPENATGYSIIWTSSDPTVATVSAGAVTGVSVGTATITARLNVSGTNLTAECTVTVEEAEEVYVPATKVEISPSTLTITENDKGPFRFTAKITPVNCTERPYWLTNRDDMIEIDPDTGEFTVLSTPTDNAVSVIVTCVVGDEFAEAIVNIKPVKPELQIIPNEDNELYDKEPKNTAKLDVAFVNSSKLPDVTWKSSDTSIATVSKDGTVTAKKAGTCTVTVTCKDDSSISATYTLTVKKANFISVRVGQTVTIDPSLIPSDPETWINPGTNVSIDETALTVTGLIKTEDQPIKIACVSKSDKQLYMIEVHVLSAE